MNIPIRMAIDGYWVPGEISKVMGAGATEVYHVTVRQYYWGRLRFYNGAWVYDPSPISGHDFAAFFTFWKS